MLWRMQQRGIKQSQGFQVIYIVLHSYVYLCLPTYSDWGYASAEPVAFA